MTTQPVQNDETFSAAEPLRIVVADDSPIVCQLMTMFLESAPELKVVATASTGRSVVELTKKLRPDVITLDVEMPADDGLTALKRIMAECPAPVIMVSGVSQKAADTTLQAIHLGATDFIFKYEPGKNLDPDVLRQDLIQRVMAAGRKNRERLFAEAERKKQNGRAPGAIRGTDQTTKAQVFRSAMAETAEEGGSIRPKLPQVAPAAISASLAPPPDMVTRPRPTGLRLDGIVVIGSSTGGPLALREVLQRVTSDFNGAIVVIQQMPANFTPVFIGQLSRQLSLAVQEAQDGQELEPGIVYVAPNDKHLLITAEKRIQLSDGLSVNGKRPSIDIAMDSAAKVFKNRVNGVLLTGSGPDGVEGLSAIQRSGGRTLVQDPRSCLVPGTPNLAIERGLGDVIGTPALIGQEFVFPNS